ncbi:MAG: hydroxyacid dehydrogenase [Deltaproteobacteria bacterium]|nr:hydroxyacid dehydrogenase [Deltaproteobacteria bacterium]MDQ3297637.1 hydroxyacid dehydrogenase [Myxococcota bacterium]
MRLLYCGSGWLPIVEHIAARLPAEASIAVWDRRCPLIEIVGDVDVLLPSNAAITAGVIEAAPRLVLIQQPAAGTEGIDREAAAARGIPICNAPGTNHVAVAEAALFLLLSLARRAPLAQQAFAERRIGEPLGFELAGKTLGIIGMGRSGTALAERARALGMTVIALARGASEADRARFFGACHAVSIHCPLTAETRGLFDARAFAALPPGAMVVNCARGGVIDREALGAALATGNDRLGGVGLDVLWDEPGDPEDPLFADPRVVVLPHVAGSTAEAFTRIVDVVIENLARLARGEPLRHRVG